MRVDRPVTTESIAQAKADAKRERDDIFNRTGIRITDDGFTLPAVPVRRVDREDHPITRDTEAGGRVWPSDRTRRTDVSVGVALGTAIADLVYGRERLVGGERQ